MDYIQFTTEQLLQARSTNLYDYMLQHYPGDVQKCGFGVIQLKAHDSLKIKQGWTGYFRHSNDEHADAIHFLHEYYGLTFHELVLGLLGSRYRLSLIAHNSDNASSDKKSKNIPLMKDGSYNNIIAYLCSRGLSSVIINKLIEAKLLYQDIRYNAVFVHKNKGFTELKGTYTYGDKAFE